MRRPLTIIRGIVASLSDGIASVGFAHDLASGLRAVRLSRLDLVGLGLAFLQGGFSLVSSLVPLVCYLGARLLVGVRLRT